MLSSSLFQNLCVDCVNDFFFGGVVCFYNPTSPPRSSIGLVLSVPLLHLKFPAFKGVTRGMRFKQTSPPLCYPRYMQVRPAAWSKPIHINSFIHSFIQIVITELRFSGCQSHRNNYWPILTSYGSLLTCGPRSGCSLSWTAVSDVA